MANFAVINGDEIINVILCESKELAEDITKLLCVEYNDENPAYIGWKWDGVNFINPNPPVENVLLEETPAE